MARYPTANEELKQAISEYRIFMRSQRRHWVFTGCAALAITVALVVIGNNGLIVDLLIGLGCALTFIALMGIISLATMMADGTTVEGHLLYARQNRSRQRSARY